MLDTVAIPLLAKAVDIIFVESSKILDERRERRKKEDSAGEMSQEQDFIEPSLENSAKQSYVENISSKDGVLQIKVDQAKWKLEEDRVKSLINLLAIHTRNYYHYREQKAAWGEELVPPYIVNGIRSEEQQIVLATKELQDILSSVYGRNIIMIKDADIRSD